jgi:hypothetical protein
LLPAGFPVSTRELHRLNRTERIQVRFRAGELQVIEAVARSRGMPRSEWVRVTLAAAVAQITTPGNSNAEPQQVRRASDKAGDGRPRHRAAIRT